MYLNQKPLPGYTGYIPEKIKPEIEIEDDVTNYIPGYSGFVKGIKGENLFGTTYGKLTQISKSNSYNKGIDVSKQEKYLTIIKENFINHNDGIRKIIFDGAGPKDKTEQFISSRDKIDIDYNDIINNY